MWYLDEYGLIVLSVIAGVGTWAIDPFNKKMVH